MHSLFHYVQILKRKFMRIRPRKLKNTVVIFPEEGRDQSAPLSLCMLILFVLLVVWNGPTQITPHRVLLRCPLVAVSQGRESGSTGTAQEWEPRPTLLWPWGSIRWGLVHWTVIGMFHIVLSLETRHRHWMIAGNPSQEWLPGCNRSVEKGGLQLALGGWGKFWQGVVWVKAQIKTGSFLNGDRKGEGS